MQIPYEVEERPDTGVYNAKLGIWLFLASEIMLFGGLFSAYIFLRLGAPEGSWPDHILWDLPGLINTAILILSSVTVVLSYIYVKLGDFNKFRICMIITLVSAVAFMGIKSFEYNGKFKHFGAFMKDTSKPQGYGEQITGHVIGDLSDYDDKDYILVAADSRQPIDWLSARELKKQSPAHQQQAAELAALGEDAHDAHPGPVFNHPGIIATGDKYKPKSWEHKIKVALGKEKHKEHDVFKVMKDQIFRQSMFTPGYNAYFAIYFTMTGLHALHVIGGALVLGYFCFFDHKRFFTNRKHFANRIEVGGLFWHFVDLVWIFLFPILYLL
ncbi:MAG: cytochrome c oxidase subunit 3 [Verrucomicrobiota bacterium]